MYHLHQMKKISPNHSNIILVQTSFCGVVGFSIFRGVWEPNSKSHLSSEGCLLLTTRFERCFSQTPQNKNPKLDITQPVKHRWAVLGCTGHYWAVQGGTGLWWAVLSVTGLYCAVMGCSRQYWAVIGCTGLYWDVLGGTGMYTVQCTVYRVVLGGTGLYLAVLGFTWLYWAVLGSAGLSWDLLGCTGM